MPSTRNIAAYSHIARVFEAALTQRGARLELPSRKSALAWRQQANQYRALLRTLANDGTSKYDVLVVRLAKLPDDHVVLIELRENALIGKLTDLEGNPIEAPQVDVPKPEVPMTEDERLDLALGIADEN